VVADTHAVVDPGAVVVEALHTVAADRAVSTATGADRVAVGAQLGTIDYVKHVHEINFFVGDVSWLHARRDRKENEREREESQIEYGGPEPHVYASNNKSSHHP